MKNYILVLILFIVASVLVIFFYHDDEFIKTGSLYISEIVASNSYTYQDEDSEYSDYIELYNGYDYDINLSGYRLSDSEFEPKKWIFPDITIKSKDYLIVFASGKNKCIENCHTNFKLKKDGEKLLLIDATGNIINKVIYPKLDNDISYSFNGKKYIVTEPSPLEVNNQKEIKTIDIKDYNLSFNEYMSHNKGSVYVDDGGYYDWVEIYNNSELDLNLEGLYLSDDSKNLNKYKIPNVIIKGYDYLVIYLTGGTKVENKICANFKLSDKDEKLIISGNGKIIDEVNIVSLDKNVSYGKKDNEWLYFLTPTPGKENNTSGVKQLGGDNGST